MAISVGHFARPDFRRLVAGRARWVYLSPLGSRS